MKFAVKGRAGIAVDRIREPQNARSRRTREAILEATWRVLEDEGAAAATTERIAALAGTSRRSVYLHFASRTELLLALREHVDEVLDLEASVAPIREARTPGAVLDAWATHVARYHARIAPLVRAIAGAARTDPEAAAMWEQAMQHWYEPCLGFAAGAEAAGALAAPWTARTAADLLWSLMSVDLLEDLVDDRGWSVDEYAARLALVARRTLLTDPDLA